MKITLGILVALTLSAHAQNYFGQRIGQFQFYHGSDGSQWTTQDTGRFQFQHGTDGAGRQFFGTGQRIGNFQSWRFQSTGQ